MKKLTVWHRITIKKPLLTPLLTTVLLFSQINQPAQASAPTTEHLPPTIAEALTASKLSADSVSIVVQPLTKPATSKPLSALIDYHGNVPRIPASTQKLIPTLIALDSLGKDFRWQTELWLKGVVMGDTLHGDVIVKGGGDPKLEAPQLDALIANLHAKGIRHIDGDVWVDNTRFRNVAFDVNAFDRKGARPYNAMPNALLINFGTVTVDLQPDDALTQKLNQPRLLTAVPVAVKNALNQTVEPTQAIVVPPPNVQPLTADDEPSEKSSSPVLRQFDKFKISVTPKLADFVAPTHTNATHAPCRGMTEEKLVKVTSDALNILTTPSVNCGDSQSYWLTYPNADAMAVKAVKARIQQLFPDFNGQVNLAPMANFSPSLSTKTTPKLWQILAVPRLLAVHRSAPLSEQIYDINHYSNNVMTEQVALSLPVYAEHKAFSDYPQTFDFMGRWWQKHLPSHQAPVMTRASGLCRDCRVTPNSLMAVLTYAYGRPDFATYQTSMGLAGVSGTIKPLKHRQPNNPAIGRAWIKTGTLDNVASMAGYVQGQSGKWYAVVAMINAPSIMYNTQAKAILDEMLAWTAVQ